MGVPRTLPAVTVASAASPVPAVSGPVIAAVSFSIKSGIATIVLGANNLPSVGYNGPAGYKNVDSLGRPMDIYGSNRGQGQQVALWGFTTATYFNGLVITVLDNDPMSGSFRFYFDHANVSSTADTGNTAADFSIFAGDAATVPGISGGQHFRAVRIELDQAASSNIVYVGDKNVSATQYLAALTLTGQLSIEIASENIPADRIWMVASVSAVVHVSVIY